MEKQYVEFKEEVREYLKESFLSEMEVINLINCVLSQESATLSVKE